MDIFPAIDLHKGQCVRLLKGDFNAVTFYEPDPVLQARKFAAASAKWLHIVDLDGAKAGKAAQSKTIGDIVAGTTLQVQVGGGIRSAADIDALLKSGVCRVVVGSASVREPANVKGWMSDFGPDKIVLALDIAFENGEPQIFTDGWQQNSGQPLFTLIDSYLETGLTTVLCTDIGRDGMMGGPNLSLYKEMQQHFPALDVLASGGVGTLDDLAQLRRAGAAGVVIGKALYEQRFTLEQAMDEAANAG